MWEQGSGRGVEVEGLAEMKCERVLVGEGQKRRQRH